MSDTDDPIGDQTDDHTGDTGVRVPRLMLLTNGNAVPRGRTLTGVILAAVSAGLEGVVVRERCLPVADRRNVGRMLRAATQASGRPVQLLWAAPDPDPEPDSQYPALGLHLRAHDDFPRGSRPPLVGRSCHNPAELRRAADEGCDYVTLSPVAESGSKPGYGPALGPEGLHRMLTRAAYLTPHTPRVLALGGVTHTNARRFVEAGAHGVAVMGAVMGADDPHAASACLLAEAVA